MSAYHTSKYNSIDLPTAAKTNAFEISPFKTDVNHSRMRSPKYRNKLHHAKNTISQLIGEVVHKRDMNEEGVLEVRNTNIEALQFLGEQHSQSFLTPRKTLKGTRASENYQSFQDPNKLIKSMNNHEFTPTKTFNDFNNAHESIDHRIAPFYSPQSKPMAVNQPNLRTALDLQLLKNNELMKKVSKLDEQNEMMRQQFNRSNQIPHYVLNELDQLKKENEMLKNDTLRLLSKY